MWKLEQRGAHCRLHHRVYRAVASSDLLFPAFPISVRMPNLKAFLQHLAAHSGQTFWPGFPWRRLQWGFPSCQPCWLGLVEASHHRGGLGTSERTKDLMEWEQSAGSEGPRLVTVGSQISFPRQPSALVDLFPCFSLVVNGGRVTLNIHLYHPYQKNSLSSNFIFSIFMLVNGFLHFPP